MINAVIPVWKPVDWTSFDVVKKIRRQIKPAKVGHAGTLDPFAEGVLMICTGEFTKKVESLMDKEKEYIADIQLGIETDTLDPTGNIVKTANIPDLSKEQIKKVLKIRKTILRDRKHFGIGVHNYNNFTEMVLSYFR